VTGFVAECKQAARTMGLERWYRPATLAIVGGLLVFLAFRAYVYATHWDQVIALVNSADHRIYMAAAERIRSGGPMYPTWQLAGPFTLSQEPELYPPPTVLLLIVPMSLLPAVLWWLVPVGTIAAVVAYHRPSLAALGGILLCLSFQWTWDGIASGGLFMYVAAAVALGTVWPWMSVAALLKPTLAPFALIGAGTRGWWIVLGLAAAVSALMLPLWIDYIRAVLNLRGGVAWEYVVYNGPLVLVPVVAWLGRAIVTTPRAHTVSPR
jgi:hypothetical protein